MSSRALSEPPLPVLNIAHDAGLLNIPLVPLMALSPLPN
jgi:hypothetical protein